LYFFIFFLFFCFFLAAKMTPRRYAVSDPWAWTGAGRSLIALWSLFFPSIFFSAPHASLPTIMLDKFLTVCAIRFLGLPNRARLHAQFLSRLSGSILRGPIPFEPALPIGSITPGSSTLPLQAIAAL